MDRFLKPNSGYYRLWSEYHRHNGLIVACDFDNTLYDYHQTGESFDMVRQLIRDLYALNCYIIIWTGNKDESFVTSFLDSVNVPFHSINKDAPMQKKYGRKINADVFVDDRAGLIQVYEDLTRLVNEIKSKKPLPN